MWIKFLVERNEDMSGKVVSLPASATLGIKITEPCYSNTYCYLQVYKLQIEQNIFVYVGCHRKHCYFPWLQIAQVATTVSSTQTEDQASILEDSTLVQGTSADLTSLGKLDEPPVLESSNEESGPKTCNCDVKYTRILAEQRERLDRAHRDDKQKALDEQSDRVSLLLWWIFNSLFL